MWKPSAYSKHVLYFLYMHSVKVHSNIYTVTVARIGNCTLFKKMHTKPSKRYLYVLKRVIITERMKVISRTTTKVRGKKSNLA